MSNLDKVNFEGMLKHEKSPFAKKEKTKTMRIRLSVYDKLRERSFKNKTKMNHELDNLISEALKYEDEHGSTSNK